MMSLKEALSLAHDDIWDHPIDKLSQAGLVLSDRGLYEVRMIIELKLAYIEIIKDKLELEDEENC